MKTTENHQYVINEVKQQVGYLHDIYCLQSTTSHHITWRKRTQALKASVSQK